MSGILAEYQRFLVALADRTVSEDVRRMANLVLDVLPQLAEVGATRRARSVRLAPIAVERLCTASPDLPELTNIESDIQFLGRIHELNVGPFRGFMRSEVFDLSRNITLIYGANGTGKSSFCEALETALLGSISEAQVKRVDHRTYCNNARLRRFVNPVLTSVNGIRPPTPIQPNENAYRFCFIEKNRIDDFARIAAKTPGDQRQLIATLFGVDQFADFVRGFNQSLDENLDLIGRNAKELATRRTQLAVAEQIIHEHPDKLEQLDQQEAILAENIQPGSSYSAACDVLLGNATQQGRLAYVNECLDTPLPVVYGITVSGLTDLLNGYNSALENWLTSQAELAKRSSEVSFSQLYDAVLQLADSLTDECPACGTNLKVVTYNPYERARNGLEQLDELSQLQSCSIQQEEVLKEVKKALYLAINNAVKALASLFPDQLKCAELPSLPSDIQSDWIAPWINDQLRVWNALLTMSKDVERLDEEARKLQTQRQALINERHQLDGFNIEIERAKAKRNTFESQFLTAQETVRLFDESNRELIEAVVAEEPIVQIHLRVKNAYNVFIEELRRYYESLPAQLLQGLGQSALAIYNSFNRDDPSSDLLHALWLPLAENEKIELEFTGEPGIRYDALVILSEGHIRCLGLAILLAKNIAENCPVVIFDDVVNAIDDEHRNGIWRTFFENGFLDSKQIILTSHAEEFLLRIQQELGSARVDEIKLYKFLPHEGEHELRIDSHPPSKNYVILALRAYADDDKRDALRHARPAIESLTDRLWTWLGNHGDGRIELKLAGPRSQWELNNKCNKLRSALRRLQNRPEGLDTCLEALDVLLGVNSISIEWGSLNGGTHDSQRDGEFDRATVRTIVEAISSLDQGLYALQHSF